jgi:hypothetical protein
VEEGETKLSPCEIAAVGGALVVEVFVTQPDFRACSGFPRDGGIDTITLQMAEITKRVALLVKCIESRRHIFVDRLIDIDRSSPIIIRAGLQHYLLQGTPIGLFQRAVHEAAAGPAAECQRGGPFYYFDALCVVEITKILDVVAEAIDEEVRARIDAPDDELIAIALALMDGNAWNITS